MSSSLCLLEKVQACNERTRFLSDMIWLCDKIDRVMTCLRCFNVSDVSDGCFVQGLQAVLCHCC